MKPATCQFVEQLVNSQWFSRVGRPVQSTDVFQVDSWGAALYATTKQWDELHLDRFNDLANAVLEHYGEADCPLDDVGYEVRAVLEPAVAKKTKEIGIGTHLLKAVRVHTTADLTLACLGTEFQSIVRIGFFESLADWYLQGHFPCGWQGEYPDGKLIIY